MIVDAINSRKVNTKFGPKDAYNVVVAGTQYSYGFKKPTFKVGDDIEFVAEEDSYGKKMDPATVRVLSSSASGGATSSAPASAAPVRGGYTPAARPFPIPPLHGDRAIVRQNSITNAVSLIKVLVEKESRDEPLLPEDLAKRAVAIARIFEAYSCGDVEMAEALKNE